MDNNDTYLVFDISKPGANLDLITPEHTRIGINIPEDGPNGYAVFCTEGILRTRPGITVTEQILGDDDLRSNISKHQERHSKLALLTAKVTLDTVAGLYLLAECHRGRDWLVGMASHLPKRPEQHAAMVARLSLITDGPTDDPALAVPNQVIAWYGTMPGLTLETVVAAIGSWIEVGGCPDKSKRQVIPLTDVNRPGEALSGDILLRLAEMQVETNAKG